MLKSSGQLVLLDLPDRELSELYCKTGRPIPLRTTPNEFSQWWYIPDTYVTDLFMTDFWDKDMESTNGLALRPPKKQSFYSKGPDGIRRNLPMEVFAVLLTKNTAPPLVLCSGLVARHP